MNEIEDSSIVSEAQESRTAKEQRDGVEGKLERLATHTRGLAEDVRTWIDLKLELTKLEIEEKIEEKIRGIMMLGVLMVLAVLVVVFALVAASFGLGHWLGHPAWGFLCTTGALMVALLIVKAIRSRGKRASSKEPLQRTHAKSEQPRRLP
jgi:uncharacterized membrane protein YqjE